MAHGQMDSQTLEAVMLKFFHREADILIASAIIQSGIDDVPTANTIIVNRADAFIGWRSSTSCAAGRDAVVSSLRLLPGAG